MEFVVFILCAVILVVLLNNAARQRRLLHSLVDNISELNREIARLRKEVFTSTKTEVRGVSDQSTAAVGPAFEPTPVPREEAKPLVVPQVPEVSSEPVIEPSAPGLEMASQDPLPAQPAYQSQAPTIEAEPTLGWMQRFLQNNPDLEKFIGENLINKIGIAVLVLGISFFVKYAIDKEWINEVGRVCIGLGCGALLIGLAHFLRLNYKAFSSVLAGGGLAIFYFTIAFAFHQYALISQTAAFVLMSVITLFAVILALLYDKVELAAIAAIGGFITPFLVSTGSGNYVVLFSYLVILNTGMVLVSYFKRWALINVLSLFFTIIITAGWIIASHKKTYLPSDYLVVFWFVVLYYALFVAMALVNQVRNKTAFKPFDFTLLLLINASFFSAGILLLKFYAGERYLGLFTLVQGSFNLSIAYWYFKKPDSDKRLLYLLIGLTLTLLSLTIPVQLQGHTITLFWCAEFVLLYWLWQRSGINLFRIASLIILGASGVSLLGDWLMVSEQVRQTHPGQLPLLYNDLKGLATNLTAVAAFSALYFLMRKEAGSGNYLLDIPMRYAMRFSLMMAVGLLYLTCLFGINLAFREFSSFAIPNVYHRIITSVFVLAVGFIFAKDRRNRTSWLQVLMLFAVFLYYVVSIGQVFRLRNFVLNGNAGYLHVVAHWISDLLLFYLVYRIIQLVRERKDVFHQYLTVLTWLISASIVMIISFEGLHLVVLAGYSGSNTPVLTKAYQKAGLTILFAVCSFVMMWVGMKNRFKPLRIISLSLFALSLVKLFLVDIRGISEGGKIAAFILLGVLLLVVSFMYQKLKKIIIDDKE